MINHTDADKNSLLHACAMSVEGSDSEVLDPTLIKVIKNLQDIGAESTANDKRHTPRDVFLSSGTLAL